MDRNAQEIKILGTFCKCLSFLPHISLNLKHEGIIFITCLNDLSEKQLYTNFRKTIRETKIYLTSLVWVVYEVFNNLISEKHSKNQITDYFEI